MPPELSIFKNAVTNTPFDVRADVATLVNRIRSEKYQSQTDHLRSLPQDAAKEYKKTALFAVTWSGTFAPTRSKSNLEAHSGLICIDLDKLHPERLNALQAQLKADMFTHVLFISPSGNGLKCVLRIDYQHPTDHESFFRQIGDYYRDYYGITDSELDASGKNVDRLCFLPYDPQCFYNPDSVIMPLADEYVSNTTQPLIVELSAPTTTTRTDYRKLARCADLIRNAPDGEKHTILCKAATLAGGFIASGMVSELDAIRVLEDEIRAKPNVNDFEAARRTIRTQIEFGKTKPIHDEYVNIGVINLQRREGSIDVEWRQPTSLKTTLLPVLPMEPDMIPEPLRDWLTDIAHRMKCPLDFPASAAVVMLSSLIGPRLTIKPKSLDDWTVVPNLWGAVIGDPSALKTPSVNEVFKPLVRLIAESRESHEQEIQRYNAEQATYEAQKKVYQLQEGERLRGKTVSSPVGYPEAPQKPTERRYMTYDATVEKLGELLNENPNGLLQFRDELTGLLASWERSGHEQDRAFYLEAWNGNGSHTIDRIGRGTMHVKTVCVSLFGGIQPAKLLGYIQAATGYDNDGFIQRLQLAVYPDRPQWSYIDEVPDKAAHDRAFNLIRQVVERNLVTIGFDADEYNRYPYIRFDTDAQEVFKQWLIKLETDILPNETGLLAEHFTKYRSLMPSLALVFHVVNCIDASTTRTGKVLVSVEAANMAVRWVEYLMSHARRIYGLLDAACVEGATRILAEIRRGKLSDGFKVRDVVQRGWSTLKTTVEVEAAIAELMANGWIAEEIPVPTGGRPEAPRYRIHPILFNENPYMTNLQNLQKPLI